MREEERERDPRAPGSERKRGRERGGGVCQDMTSKQMLTTTGSLLDGGSSSMNGGIRQVVPLPSFPCCPPKEMMELLGIAGFTKFQSSSKVEEVDADCE